MHRSTPQGESTPLLLEFRILPTMPIQRSKGLGKQRCMRLYVLITWRTWKQRGQREAETGLVAGTYLRVHSLAVDS